ncbi:glycosyltransferase family 4 protein [Aquirhabdus sp.]|uniref:glycosyltransferase family 4 protein n=1 Tax=Aquirhabdus sp. TaxID=2824160 RepID=UPI00396C54E5
MNAVTYGLMRSNPGEKGLLKEVEVPQSEALRDDSAQHYSVQPLIPPYDNQSEHYPFESEKPLRIALVTETWPPEINGVAHSVFQLASGLRDNGHSLFLIRPQQVLSSINSPAEQELLVRGFAIPRYRALQFGAPAYYHIKEALKSYQPDVVHIVTEGPLGLAALFAARHSGIPVSSGFHSPFHEFSTHFGLGLLLTPIIAYLRFFHNRTDMTCVPSEKTRAQLQTLGIRDLAVVSRGVNVAQFSPVHRDMALRQSWGVSEHSTVLLYVGRLSPEKNIDLVIAAYRELQLAQPLRAVQLVLVGDGPDRARLEKLAPDAIFAGMKTGSALGQHYASADVFVFASQVETFGNVVLEAMASGLPVLAFDDAAAGQVVETNHTGWLCELKNELKFAQLAGQLPKQNRLQEMGKYACERVQAMGWQQAVGQLEQVLQQVKQQHGKRTHTALNESISFDGTGNSQTPQTIKQEELS